MPLRKLGEAQTSPPSIATALYSTYCSTPRAAGRRTGFHRGCGARDGRAAQPSVLPSFVSLSAQALEAAAATTTRQGPGTWRQSSEQPSSTRTNDGYTYSDGKYQSQAHCEQQSASRSWRALHATGSRGSEAPSGPISDSLREIAAPHSNSIGGSDQGPGDWNLAPPRQPNRGAKRVLARGPSRRGMISG